MTDPLVQSVADLENSVKKIVEWVERDYVLTRLGVARVISIRSSGTVELSFVHPQNENQPDSMTVSEIFPICDDMIITVANPTQPIGWGRFVKQDLAATIWQDTMPDQTNHWIKWNEGAIVETNKILLCPKGEEPTVTIEAWLDRIAPVKIGQFYNPSAAITFFSGYEQLFGGVTCGIFTRLAIDFNQGRVIGLSLYGDTDKILPIEPAGSP